MDKEESGITSIEDLAGQFKHIKGWGIDADPRNEPTYPMKQYSGADHSRLNYDRPVQQVQRVEILRSNERPTLSAVFGTSVPPSGWSGQLRRYAFRSSESSYAHWLPLLFADRVNVIEGLADDLKKGHFPNILLEKGLRAEWRFNRPALVKKLALLSFAVVVCVAIRSAQRTKHLWEDD